MDPVARLRGPARERFALALGLASAALLAGAAFAPFTDPDLAGRAELARVAGRVADGVVEEWNRILEDPEAHAAPVGDTFVWREADMLRILSDVKRVEIAPDPDAPANAFDTLLRESEREEAGSPDAALAVVLEALDKKCDAGQRAEARLHAIRLAVRAEKPETARQQFDLAQAELSGAEARHGVSYLLLDGLAAMPALDAAKQEEVRSLLVERWTSCALALPTEGGTLDRAAGLRVEIDPMTEALRARLLEIAPEPRLLQDLENQRVRRLSLYLGQSRMPRPEDDAIHSRVDDASENLLVWRRTPPDVMRLVAIPFASLEQALRASLAQHALLPDGFRVDFTGEDSGAGAIVRDRTPLDRETDSVAFWLRHTDPDAFARRSTRRLWTIRGGLLLLAGFALAGGLATWRAMRRERHLASTRTAFVANVSHELRTPLASILLMAENLEAGRVPASAQARYHASIRREAGRLRRLVDDVLDFSRVERGKELEVRIEDTSLPAWIDGLRTDLVDWAQRSSIDLAISIGDLPASAAIDPEALRRAVFNLLDNARLHSGSREIAFAARGSDASLVLSVADRGRGIPRARRREIFEPFARIESAGDGAPGTGLGLAIVREIARAHGGLVRLADPEEGPGSVFEIEIPARTVEAANA